MCSCSDTEINPIIYDRRFIENKTAICNYPKSSLFFKKPLKLLFFFSRLLLGKMHYTNYYASISKIRLFLLTISFSNLVPLQDHVSYE